MLPLRLRWYNCIILSYGMKIPKKIEKGLR